MAVLTTFDLKDRVDPADLTLNDTYIESEKGFYIIYPDNTELIKVVENVSRIYSTFYFRQSILDIKK